MDYFDCRMLKALAEHRNITKASHALFVSQPAITKRLKQLEEEFGVPLFQRLSKGISFTPQGEHLIRVADQTLLNYELLTSDLKSMNGIRVAGRLKCGAIYLLNERVIPNMIAAFSQQYPDVTYDILSEPNVKLYNKLSNNELHLAFLREDYTWPHERILVDREKIHVVSKEEISLSQLPLLPRIDPVRNSKFNAALELWWNENYSAPPRIFANVSNSNTGLELVSRGLGYSIVAESAIRGREDEFYTIPLCDTRGVPVIRNTWLYYKEETLRLGQAKAFVNFIRDHYEITATDVKG